MSNIEISPKKPFSPSNSRRRIAFCITDLDPGGAEKALYQLVVRLNRNEWEPAVFCLGPEADLAPQLREHQIPVHCYGAENWRSWGVFAWLTHELRTFQPAILQCSMFHANFVGRIAGRRAGVPIVLSGHRVAEREKHWHLWLDRVTRRWVDHHVCVSQGVADHIVRKLKIAKEDVSVIPNGVSLPELDDSQVDLRTESGWLSDAKIVLAVGRLHPQKGFLQLLEAFRMVSEAVPESRLLILGEGPQRPELEIRVRALNLEGRVRLAGFRKNAVSLMLQADVLALSSNWEGMPNVVLEAMAVGLPVVSTAVEGISELIRNEQDGLIVTCGDIRGLAQSIERILTDPHFAKELEESAQHIVQSEFTWEQNVLKHEHLYCRLIK